MFKYSLKYDLRQLYRFLCPVYLVVIVFAIVARVCQLFEQSFFDATLGPVIRGMGIGCAIGALTNNTMRVWTYFRNNLYGDEGYLTNALPLTKRLIYGSKFLAACLTIFTSLLLVVFALFMVYGTPENLEIFGEFINESAQAFRVPAPLLMLATSLIVLVEFYFLIAIGFFGIILGQRAQNAKTLRAAAYGVATFFASQLAFVAIIFLASFFIPGLREFFAGQTTLNNVRSLFPISGICYLGVIIGLSFGSIKLLNSGINLD